MLGLHALTLGKFARNFLPVVSFASSVVTARAMRLGLTVLAGRVLVPHDFGVLIYVLTVAGVGQTIVESGVDTVYTRRAVLEPRRDQEWFDTAWTLKTLVAAVVGLAIGMELLLDVIGPVQTSLVLLLLLVTSWENLAAARQRVSGQLRSVTRSNALRVAALVCAFVGLAVSGVATIGWILLSTLVAEVVGVLALGRWPRTIPTSFQPMRRLAGAAFSVGLVSLFASLYSRLPVLVLAAYFGPNALAVFGAGSRFVEATQLLPAIIVWFAFPSLCAARPGRGTALTVEALVSLSLTIGGLASTALLLGSAPLLQFAYGGRYAEGVVPLRMMTGLIILLFLNPTLTSTLYSQHREKLVAAITFANVVTGVLVLSALVPPFGLAGAVLGWTLIEAQNSLLHVAYIARSIPRTSTVLVAALVVVTVLSTAAANAGHDATLAAVGLVWIGIAVISSQRTWSRRAVLVELEATAFGRRGTLVRETEVGA